MTRTEKENLGPVWERITISLEEAAAYSGIGVRKLRDMTDKPEYAQCGGHFCLCKTLASANILDVHRHDLLHIYCIKLYYRKKVF